ncbi:hypothetical protein H2201_003070 [Coniosporium apollinis]|uniref:Uncharacterized protein n=1 Tax=Coniosporium apollinis TaxID=61459 RepID=A0ABQ9P0W2_9PEZI|nr:hypothetical protein H2201_003070 [Coniosporium apollinis]
MEGQSNLSQFYGAKYEEAHLPLFYRAGCHLMLAAGEENYVYHAEQALRYYEEMLRNSPDHEDYSRLVDHARSVLEQARSDQVNEIEVEVEADEEDEEGEEDTAAGASQSEETTERAQEQ